MTRINFFLVFVFVIRTPFQSCSDLQQSFTPKASKKKKKKIWRQLHWHDSCCWQWLNTFLTFWLSTHLCKFSFFFKYVFAKHDRPPPSKSNTFRWFERFTISKIYSQQNLVDVDDAFSLFFRVELKTLKRTPHSSACSIWSNSKIGFSTKWILFYNQIY